MIATLTLIALPFVIIMSGSSKTVVPETPIPTPPPPPPSFWDFHLSTVLLIIFILFILLSIVQSIIAWRRDRIVRTPLYASYVPGKYKVTYNPDLYKNGASIFGPPPKN